MLLRSPARRSIALRSVVLVVVLLVGVGVVVAVAVLFAAADRGRLAPSLVASTADLSAAVERTVAAGTARIDATYHPAHGPPVSITGRTSLVGPEAELSAAVGDDPPTTVRVAADGAWLRRPDAEEWTPVSVDAITGAAAARGWGDVLRTLDERSDVRTDVAGRIVQFRLARDRQGGTLDVRLSAFGTEVVTVPP